MGSNAREGRNGLITKSRASRQRAKASFLHGLMLASSIRYGLDQVKGVSSHLKIWINGIRLPTPIQIKSVFLLKGLD